MAETDDLIESLGANFLRLKSSPEDRNLLNEIFRAAHTVKGSFDFLGLEQVSELMNKMEDVLNKLRKSEPFITPRIMDILLEAV